MKKIAVLLIVFVVGMNFNPIYAKNYKGGELRTLNEFKYGRFDVRYKPANREGIVSSFFTYFTGNDSIPWASYKWNEIDIEIVGRYKNNVQFNAITPGQTFHIRSNYVDFDPYADFHEYGFEWTPDYVAWFIDGEEVFRQLGEHVTTLNNPQKLMMNIWNPIYTNWVGYFDNSFLPAVSTYDWVQYSNYTPGSGDYGTNNDFTVDWKDEFEIFDETRWDKASHSFSGNQADFTPENVVFSDGYMKLFLTNSTDLGDVDNIPPNINWARGNYDKSILIQFSEEIERSAAESLTNYVLPGVSILNAELSADHRKVLIMTDSYDPFTPANLIVKNITEDKVSPLVKSLQAISVNPILIPLSFPMKVNVGGEEYKDYLPDQEWSPKVEYGYYSGRLRTFSGIDILGTSDDEVFLTERAGIVSYKFHVPNGVYNLSFLFAEKDNNLAGDCTFNIIAENEYVRSDIDVFAEIGKNAVLKIEKEITVSDEYIDIYFEQNVDSTFVNAIILDQISTGLNDEKNLKLNNNFELYQNYPNPFNGYTHINYFLPKRSDIELQIYNVLGVQVLSEKIRSQEAGLNGFNWDGKNSAGQNINSGVYIYRISTNDFKQSRKMIYLK